jgi:DNA polymerase III alpha subunit
MRVQCDIDIDFANREDILSKIPHVVAMRNDKGEVKKHNTGVYLHKIPADPITNIATIDYETAEARGYFKIDFLNVNAYQGIKNEAHLTQLINTEPLWDLMYEKEVCDQLFHINGYDRLLAGLKPTSILELATVLALIRPGKKHLVVKCAAEGFSSIQDEVWTKTDEGYSFKKSHGIAYAHVIVMQLNKICESVSHEFS